MNITVVQVVNPLQKLKYVQQHVACFLRNNYWPAKKKEGKSAFKFLYLIIVRLRSSQDYRQKYQIKILIL